MKRFLFLTALVLPACGDETTAPTEAEDAPATCQEFAAILADECPSEVAGYAEAVLEVGTIDGWAPARQEVLDCAESLPDYDGRFMGDNYNAELQNSAGYAACLWEGIEDTPQCREMSPGARQCE